MVVNRTIIIETRVGSMASFLSIFANIRKKRKITQYLSAVSFCLYLSTQTSRADMSLFSKPWKMTAGFLFGGALVLAGLVLQVVKGPVDWDDFLTFPAGIIFLVLSSLVLVTAFLLRKRVGFFGWLGSPASAVPSIAWTLVLTIIMGFTAQVPSRGWLGSMTTFLPFVFVYTWMTAVVGMVALNHLSRLTRSWREVSASLNHLGLYVILVCATLGSADKQTLEMTLHEGAAETAALREDGTSVDTGLSILLNDFIMETYPSGMPKRIASDVLVRRKSGEDIPAVIEVNKPLKVDGWKMYQYDYDSEAGSESTVSVLQLVRDPWLPLVFTGIFMMLVGALLLMVMGFKKEDAE